MIPILYDKHESSFATNGLGRLADCLSCTVTEERNGIYECTFQYPVNGEMYSELLEGRIIGVIHDDVKDIQPFDIYAHSAPLDGVVTFYARHVSYRLGNVILRPMTATTCAAALAAIPNNTYNSCPFTFWTDKSVSATFENKIPSAVKAILGGQQGSILDVYGKGEYKWDGFTVRLYTNRGVDNGVSIRYGVNLTDLTHEYDESSSYNAVAPFWRSNEDDTVVTLTNGIVISNAVDTYFVPWTTQAGEEIKTEAGDVIQFPMLNIKPVPLDLSDAFEEAPTEAQLKAEALRRMNNAESWLPSENITVSFINLADTEEYKNVAALQRVSLCDKVSVYCGPLGVSAVKMQVIRVVYNVLTERYDEIELGKAKTTFAETLTNVVAAQIEEATKDMPSVSMMQSAIDNATKQITGANGGHVRFIYDANGDMQEIVIMDTDDISTAVNVWRFNAGGFGFSSHGYAGPYTTAITQDGQIVADMITTGILNANLIKTGVLDGELIKAKLLQIIDAAGNVIASYNDIITIGQSNQSHLEIDYNSLELFDNNGGRYLSIGELRDSSGYTTLTEAYIGNGTRNYVTVDYSIYRIDSVTINGVITTNYTVNGRSITFNSTPADGAEILVTYKTNVSIYHYDLGIRTSGSIIGANSAIANSASATAKNSFACNSSTASGENSHAEGYNSDARGFYSHAEGRGTVAANDSSHAEGYESTASGICSHAEGSNTTASNDSSHAEGSGSIASGAGSHAEGGKLYSSDPYPSTASSTAAHAEGSATLANGICSHAEGRGTIASGEYSHAEGRGTVARTTCQHVSGSYNVEDTSQSYRSGYLEIIGNGSSDSNKSNARTLNWSGNEWIAGTLTQASDKRLKTECGEIPDLSSIHAKRFKWNENKGEHDDKDHIGYFAQDVEKLAPYLVHEDAMGYKSLDYIALLCAKVDALEKRVSQLEGQIKRGESA